MKNKNINTRTDLPPKRVKDLNESLTLPSITGNETVLSDTSQATKKITLATIVDYVEQEMKKREFFVPNKQYYKGDIVKVRYSDNVFDYYELTDDANPTQDVLTDVQLTSNNMLKWQPVGCPIGTIILSMNNLDLPPISLKFIECTGSDMTNSPTLARLLAQNTALGFANPNFTPNLLNAFPKGVGRFSSSRNALSESSLKPYTQAINYTPQVSSTDVSFSFEFRKTLYNASGGDFIGDVIFGASGISLTSGANSLNYNSGILITDESSPSQKLSYSKTISPVGTPTTFNVNIGDVGKDTAPKNVGVCYWIRYR